MENKVAKNEETECFELASKAKNNCCEFSHIFTDDNSYSIPSDEELFLNDSKVHVDEHLSVK